jgi:hypothetical protein
MQRDQNTPSTKKKQKYDQIHQTKKFKSIEIIKRDLNGSLNILLKGRCIIEGKIILDYMNRKTFVMDQTN